MPEKPTPRLMCIWSSCVPARRTLTAYSINDLRRLSPSRSSLFQTMIRKSVPGLFCGCIAATVLLKHLGARKWSSWFGCGLWLASSKWQTYRTRLWLFASKKLTKSQRLFWLEIRSITSIPIPCPNPQCGAWLWIYGREAPRQRALKRKKGGCRGLSSKTSGLN